MLYKIFLLYIKMDESADLTYYQRNRDVILNRARDYYEYVKGSAYRIHFWYMSKDDSANIMNGSNLVNKRGVL